MMRGAFRQARQLAEGQKSADVEHNWALPPLSANSDNWRRGSNFLRKTALFANFAPHLAEGVKFPEKNPGSHFFEDRRAQAVPGDFEPGRRLPRCHTLGISMKAAAC